MRSLILRNETRAALQRDQSNLCEAINNAKGPKNENETKINNENKTFHTPGVCRISRGH